MPTKTMNPTLGDVLKHEYSREVCRESVTLATGNLLLGTVLGRREVDTTQANIVAAATAGNTGNGTIALANPAVLAHVQPGTYTIRFTAATAFVVVDPEQDVIGTGATGAAFARQVAFTITAGGTAFVAGDSFTITVPYGTGQVVQIAATPQADGSHRPYGILLQDTDASAAAQATAALARGPAVLALNQLIWPSGLNTALLRRPALDALALRGIVARTTA